MLQPSRIDVMRLMVKESDEAINESLYRAGFDMTHSDWALLRLISNGCATPRALREELRVTQQFISKTLTRLVTFGCVEMKRDSIDKRRRHIVVTHQGTRAAALVRAWDQHLAAAIPAQGLTIDALSDFRRQLDQIVMDRSIEIPAALSA